MALAADRNLRTKVGGGTRHNRGALAAGAVIFLGALIARNAAGNIVPAADTAGLKVIGIAEESVDNTDGDAGDETVMYATGVGVELDNAGGAIVLASQHTACYVASDAGVTTAAVAAHDILAGIVTEFTAAKVWVYVDEALSIAVDSIPLDGADVDTVANSQVLGGVLLTIPVLVTDSATGDTADVVLTEKMEFIGASVIKQGGAGAATNTITIKNAANAITDAMDLNVADKIVVRPATIDDAYSTFAAGGLLRLSHVKGGGNSQALVLCNFIKRA